MATEASTSSSELADGTSLKQLDPRSEDVMGGITVEDAVSPGKTVLPTLEEVLCRRFR